MWRRIGHILKKEILQALREPRMRILLFLPPLLQLILFGYAVNLDVERARVAWMDEDRTPESRDLLALFQGSPNFKVTQVLQRPGQVREVIDAGEVEAVVRVLAGFARDIERRQTAQVQVLVDGSNSNTAAIVSNYAAQIVGLYSEQIQQRQQRQLMVEPTRQARAPVSLGLPRLQVRSRVWFNENLRSQDYFVPGVLVNIIALVTLMLTAMAIVREKEIGTMEQLMVTPIRPVELMLGKTLPFALVGIFEVVLVTLAALLIFGIPFRGSPPFLLASAIAFLMTTLSMGLFISSVSRTQQQAMMASFFFFTPAFMLSGFAFPIRNMPMSIQYLTYLNPLRYFVEIVRGIFLKGTGIEVLWPQLAGLIVLGSALITVSSLRFTKRIE